MLKSTLIKPLLIFVTCDSTDGTRTGKQHIYKPYKQRYEYTDEVYTGNKSLCGRFSILNENEVNMEFVEAKEYNEPESTNVCKNCLRSSQC